MASVLDSPDAYCKILEEIPYLFPVSRAHASQIMPFILKLQDYIEFTHRKKFTTNELQISLLQYPSIYSFSERRRNEIAAITTFCSFIYSVDKQCSITDLTNPGKLLCYLTHLYRKYTEEPKKIYPAVYPLLNLYRYLSLKRKLLKHGYRCYVLIRNFFKRTKVKYDIVYPKPQLGQIPREEDVTKCLDYVVLYLKKLSSGTNCCIQTHFHYQKLLLTMFLLSMSHQKVNSFADIELSDVLYRMNDNFHVIRFVYKETAQDRIYTDWLHFDSSLTDFINYWLTTRKFYAAYGVSHFFVSKRGYPVTPQKMYHWVKQILVESGVTINVEDLRTRFLHYAKKIPSSFLKIVHVTQDEVVAPPPQERFRDFLVRYKKSIETIQTNYIFEKPTLRDSDSYRFHRAFHIVDKFCNRKEVDNKVYYLCEIKHFPKGLRLWIAQSELGEYKEQLELYDKLKTQSINCPK